MYSQRFAVTDLMTRFIRQIPEGDDRERLMCPDCGHVAYENPKVVVGSVVAEGDHILLCRRAIEPRAGFWTNLAVFISRNVFIRKVCESFFLRLVLVIVK